jgi:probable phosphoglycerate mutase
VLALVRHGESTWVAEGRFQGRADPPLSETGRAQARAVGVRLAAPEAPPSLPLPAGAPVAIVHSPLRRAAETATAIADARRADTPLIALDDLVEIAQGTWEGLTHAEVRARYATELDAWRRDPLHHHAPDGEPLLAAAARARAAAAWTLGPNVPSTPGSPPPPSAGEPPEPVLGYERRYGDPDRSPRSDWAIVVAHDGILRLLLLELLGIDLARFWSYPFALAAVTVLDVAGGLVRLRAHNLDEHITALRR